MMIGGTSVLKGGSVWGRQVRCTRKRCRFALRGPWCCSFLRGLLVRLRRILSDAVTQHGRNAAETRVSVCPAFKHASVCCGASSFSAAIENPPETVPSPRRKGISFRQPHGKMGPLIQITQRIAAGIDERRWWRQHVEAPASRNGRVVRRTESHGLHLCGWDGSRSKGRWHSATSGTKRIVDVVHETVRCPYLRPLRRGT
jgi:hypothetical protein